MIERFAGTIERFATVNVDKLAWEIMGIDPGLWPRLADPEWRRIGLVYMPEAEALKAKHFPGCVLSGVGLFLLAAGQGHPSHTDGQPPNWITRVHVPVISNPFAIAISESGPLHMEVGTAYKFNTLALHSVYNGGHMARVHLVMDIHARADG